MDLELTFYPRGSESSNGYVEVHFDIEAASLNQLATRLDEMFYEMSYAFVGKGQKSLLSPCRSLTQHITQITAASTAACT